MSTTRDDLPDDLPESFKQARAADEVFWKEQEKKIQGAMGQPCCTLSGISSGLITMSGNFAVVVHGEDECAACFRHIGANSHNFFCTGLTEHEFVTGETAEPLDTCLRLVAEEVNPNAIFVLGACPVEVIGDRFERVVDKVAADYPQIPMIAMHTSGLKVGSQAAMLDWMFEALASLPTITPVDPTWKQALGRVGFEMMSSYVSNDRNTMDRVRDRAASLDARVELTRDTCVNFIGMPGHTQRGDRTPEPIRVLQSAGLHLVGNFPRQSTFEDWQSIKFAKASFCADRSLYPKLVGKLEESGQEVVDVPLPTGVQQTLELYRAIGERYGCTDALLAAVRAEQEEAEAALAAFREQYKSLRVAVGMRMLNNYEADQIAYNGLGDYLALAEMGFEMTLLIQGPPDRRAKFEKMFERRGITHPFEMFPEPWNLSEYIGGDRYDVAYLADHCRAEARKAGVPMIVSRALEPFVEGVLPNLRHMERMLRETLK